MPANVTAAGSRRLGRPSGDHAKRQRELAHVLLKVIGTYGFDKASVRLVAREANCTTGVISHYFSSKDDLALIAVNLLFDWAEQRASVAAESVDSLRALMSAVYDDDERPTFDFVAVWLQVLARSMRNKQLAELVRKRNARFRTILTKIVRDGQKRKQIRTDVDPSLLADYFNAISDGMSLMAPIETSRFTRQRIARVAKVGIEFLRHR
jgi:TetR/AcrR family transcriptional regulator, transcriptional repressor of aconitase